MERHNISPMPMVFNHIDDTGNIRMGIQRSLSIFRGSNYTVRQMGAAFAARDAGHIVERRVLMLSRFHKYISVLVVAALVLVPLSASAAVEFQEDEPDVAAGKMAADAIVVRPLGIVATLVGGALFVVSLPFSLLGKNTGDAYERLLADPARFTFVRPLGDF